MWTYDALAAARAFVRPHGDEVEPGFLLARVVKEVEPRAPSAAVPAPRPGLAAWAAARRWPARPSARSRVVGSPVGLFLVALPATGAAHWRVLFEVLAERGHRLALVAEHDELPLAETVAGVHGVWVAGRLGARATSAAERAVAALDLRLPDLSGADAAAELRWRRRVDGVTLPPALRGLEALTGRTATLQRVRDQRDVLDRSLAPSPAARRLVDREGPDAVVVLPSLDPGVAVDSWVAHLDLARAARARNIPVAISRLGAGAVEEALAQGALRPNGVSRSTAGAIADELETWLRAGAPVRRRPVFAALSRLRARAALSMIAGAAGVRRGVSVRMRPEPGGRPRGAR